MSRETCIKRIDESRRIVFLITLVIGIISLIGSEMPWLHITQHSNTIHTWNFNTIPSNSSNNDIYETQSCNFTMELFLSLYNAEICQKFVSGYLPGTSSSSDDLIDISRFNSENRLELCVILDFEYASKYLIDSSQWNKYEDACKDSGTAVATLMILSLSFMFLSTMTHFCTMCFDTCLIYSHKQKVSDGTTNHIPRSRVRSVSNDNTNTNNNKISDLDQGLGYTRSHRMLKWLLPLISFLMVPLLSAIAIIVYYDNCISVATPQNDNQSIVLDGSSGYRGFNMGVATCVLEVIWWILFCSSVCCAVELSADVEFEEFKIDNNKNKGKNNETKQKTKTKTRQIPGENKSKGSLFASNSKIEHETLKEDSLSTNEDSGSKSDSLELQAPNNTSDPNINSSNNNNDTAISDPYGSQKGAYGNSNWMNEM